MKITGLIFVFLASFYAPGLAAMAVVEGAPQAIRTQLVTTLDDEDIPVTVHPATGGPLFVWFSSEAGPQAADEQLAEQLTQHGVEVWRVDLLAARFLPQANSSLLKVPDGDVAAVLADAQAYAATKISNSAAENKGRQVFLIANGRTALPVLRGVRQWQRDAGGASYFAGLILISPKLFVETPEPGVDAELLPIVTASNIPLYWLQPDQSPWYWKIPDVIRGFESGGSDVFVRVLHGVRDRFYFRPDANAAEDARRQQLPALLLSAAKFLATLPPKNRLAVAEVDTAQVSKGGKKANTLKAYRGDPAAPILDLRDLSGDSISLVDYRGQVVLVNFWASWCPPCVYEMPSMQRLSDEFAEESFEILAVNMAEPPAVIQEFLDTKVDVSFPVLLDHDGAALKRWQVFAFPTSFVIDKSGQIRYALFGAAEWDDPAIVEKIRRLLE